MNIYHSYFRFWKNFKDKKDFCWVAITKTVPDYYIGNIYKKLAPIGKNFEKCENPFNEVLFFKEYCKLLKSLDKNEIKNDLLSFSKNGKDVVILNWEDMHKNSEGRFAFAWMLDLSIQDANLFNLEDVLKFKNSIKDLTGMNFLEL